MNLAIDPSLKLVRIHVGAAPTIDDIPVGCWAERCQNSFLGSEIWLLLQPAGQT